MVCYKKSSDHLIEFIIRLRDQGKNNVQIGAIVDRGESTVRSILKRCDEGSLGKARGGAHNMKCTPEIRSYVEELLREDCTRTLRFLKAAIQERFSVNLAVSTIFKNMGFINFSLKQVSAIPVQRNTPEAINRRASYAQEFDMIQEEFSRAQIVFVDEAGFCVSMRRTRGWSEVNTPARVSVPFSRTRNISVCAALTANGPVAYEVRPSAYNANAFASFIESLIEKLNASDSGRCVFIMDNATIHRNSNVKSVIESSGHQIKYLPPYSPFLNPIEECFSKWKGYVKALNVLSEDELLVAINEGFNAIVQENCEGWFRNMIFYLNRSRNKDEI